MTKRSINQLDDIQLRRLIAAGASVAAFVSMNHPARTELVEIAKVLAGRYPAPKVTL